MSTRLLLRGLKRTAFVALIYLYVSRCLFRTILASSDSSTAAEAWLLRHDDDFLKDLKELLRIPSVSSHPDRQDDVIRAGQWIFNKLKNIGMENVQFLQKGGAPAVYGDWLHAEIPNAPTILIYGHYDVQPADPDSGRWTTSPFEPSVRDRKVYARGASDNKGPVVAVLYALASVFATDKQKRLPVNVKLFIEGEEEIGSPTMEAILKDYGETLMKADYSFSADGGQVSDKAPPGLVVGLRGVTDLEITVTRQGGDLHSGEFGGAIGNPLHHLARILDDLRDKETGKVLVDGFYDGVDEIGEAEKDDIATFKKFVPWEDVVLNMVGTASSHGEKGFSPYERVWFRPTREIVGFTGGYTGAGIKTVLPRTASAKISCRLVTSQRARDVFTKVAVFVKAIKAPGLDVQVVQVDSNVDPVRVRRDGVGNTAARTVLTELFGKSPIYFYSGATLPSVEIIQRHLGMDTVTFAFETPGNNLHAPDEFSRIEELQRAKVAYVKLLYEVGAEHRRAKGREGNQKDEL